MDGTRLVAFAVMVNDPGVLPVAGDTDAQLPPLLENTETLYGNTVVLSVLVTLMVWVAVPPVTALRVTLLGDADKVGVPVTVNVTGTTTLVPTAKPVSVSEPM